MNIANRFLGSRDFLEINGRGLVTAVRSIGMRQLMSFCCLSVIVAILFRGGGHLAGTCRVLSWETFLSEPI